MRTQKLVLGNLIRTEVKQLLVIYESNLQVIEKADPPDNIDLEIFRLGELDGRVPLQIADLQRDFVAIGGK